MHVAIGYTSSPTAQGSVLFFLFRVPKPTSVEEGKSPMRGFVQCACRVADENPSRALDVVPGCGRGCAEGILSAENALEEAGHGVALRGAGRIPVVGRDGIGVRLLVDMQGLHGMAMPSLL